MNYTSPHQLEKYAFYWSEVRLVLAGVALLLGGVPAVFLLLPGMYGITWPLLKLCWIISGVASAYLAYRWFNGGQHVFGHKQPKDTTAFLVSVVSGINLGLTGLLGRNIGMTMAGGKLVFIIVGVLYLWAAYHLYQRWKSHAEKIF